MSELDEIQARADAATPGPWEADDFSEQFEGNAQFIAHAREDIPFLLARVQALQLQLVAARNAWARIDRLGNREQDRIALDHALTLDFSQPDWVGAAWTATAKESEALERVRVLEAQREAALKLHTPFEWSFGYGPVKSCKHCADLGASESVAQWPCATVRALGVEA